MPSGRPLARPRVQLLIFATVSPSPTEAAVGARGAALFCATWKVCARWSTEGWASAALIPTGTHIAAIDAEIRLASARMAFTSTKLGWGTAAAVVLSVFPQ